MGSTRYRGFTQADLGAAYNNIAAAADFPGTVANWREKSARVVRELGAKVDIPYGERPRQRFDYFPAKGPNAPLLFFIHGGYWQGGEKRSVGFLAGGPVARGFAVANLEYTVAPEATLSQMIDEVRCALVAVRASAGRLGFDAKRIVLAGHSAGAHLMCSAALGTKGIIGAIAISGLYDLEPIRQCYLNAKLGLTTQDVDQFSPIKHLPPTSTPMIVAVGARELPELVRQSREFADAAGMQYLAIEPHDHFSILDELASEQGALCRHLQRFVDPLNVS
jgi:acetyl esterase/lipase